jgi:hypothetical protein
MIRNSMFILSFLLAGCLREEKKETRQLDAVAIDIQRMAMWHREYYFHVIKWKGKNQDSATLYENKMDSALNEYQKYMRVYDSLSKIHKINNK